MRILFLNNFNYPRGGSEKVMLAEMRLLQGAGHEVAVFSRAHERNEPSEYAAFFPPAMDTEGLGLSLRTLGTVGQIVYSRAARRGLREVLRRFRPDVAHAHNIYGRLSLSVVDELKRAGVPTVMTLHDLKLLCPSYLMLNRGRVCERCKGRRFYQAALTRCHKGSLPGSAVYALESYQNHVLGKYARVERFIAPSRFLLEKCVEYGWRAEKFTYLPNAVETAPPSGVAADAGYLLYLGRLSAEKGVRTLLAACENLRGGLPLRIAGDGPERADLEQRVRRAGLPVAFLGHLQAQAVQAALAGAKAVVIPSEWYENAPLSILEAFAAGKPVIGARIGGIPEMIEDGVNGLLFDSGSAAGLEHALRRFAALTQDQVTAMGAAARHTIERSFSPAVHLEGLLDVYRQVCGNRI